MFSYIVKITIVALIFSSSNIVRGQGTHVHYDVYVYSTATNEVLRLPVFHLQMNPNSQGFKKIMLRERKNLNPGEAIGYHFEGTFLPRRRELNVPWRPEFGSYIIPGDRFKGLFEPNPYPVTTPNNFPFPDDTNYFTYPWGYVP